MCLFLVPQSYKNLIGIAKDCFKQLLIEFKESASETAHIDRVNHIVNLHTNIDYSESSFMNLFNYDYGHLAPHRDRCLVTVVYTQPRRVELTGGKGKLKNLWCLQPGTEEDTARNWQSIDQLVATPGNQHNVCLHVGEELSALCNYQVPAALHCVLVDPTQAVTSVPNSLKSQGDNRFSAALILSSNDISAIVEETLGHRR